MSKKQPVSQWKPAHFDSFEITPELHDEQYPDTSATEEQGLSEEELKQKEKQKIQEQLFHLQEQARQSGYQTGFQQGLEQGNKQGYDDGYRKGSSVAQHKIETEWAEQQKQLTQQWTTLISSFDSALEEINGQISQRLVQIALQAAYHLTGETNTFDSDHVLHIIRKLIEQQPVFTQGLKLHLNPEDIPLVKTHLEQVLNSYNWQIVPDLQLHRGGCKVISAEGELDASLTTRWQMLCSLVYEDEK